MMSKLSLKDKITIIQRVVTMITSLVSTLALVMIAYHLSYAKSFLLNAAFGALGKQAFVQASPINHHIKHTRQPEFHAMPPATQASMHAKPQKANSTAPQVLMADKANIAKDDYILPIKEAVEKKSVDVVKGPAKTHIVEMLNNAKDGGIMVYQPSVIKIQPGDSIRFKPTSYGHNAQSPESIIKSNEAIPEGAKPWKSQMSKELTLTFTVPGIYLYVCSYHYIVGHIGYIQVGDDTNNLDAVRRAGALLKKKMLSNGQRVDEYLEKLLK